MVALSYKNDAEEDERLNPASDNARNLHQQEQGAYDREFEDMAANYDQTADSGQENSNVAKTKNIDKTKESEHTAGWKTNVSPNGGGSKQPVNLVQLAKKKGPLGLIGLLLGGTGIMGGTIIGPAGLLVHLKEIITNKLDTMSSVVETRSNLIMKGRMFSTNSTCAIKVRCRFSGLTDRQVQRLRIQGADILDKDGKPLSKNVLGRYTGGKTLVLADGTKVDAKDYLKTLGSNPEARDLSRSVFAPRWLSWNDKVSKKIRADKKLTTNAQWGEDEKTTRQKITANENGDSYNADNQKAPPATDSNGKPLPPNQQPPQIDLGEAADNVNAEADNLKTAATAGDAITNIPVDPAGAANMAEDAISSPSTLKKAVGFLNPADFFVAMCGTYKLTNTILIAAKTIVLVQAMRYAAQFLSTADKIKAGDAMPNDVEQPAKILETADQYGNTFGDSQTYSMAEYGKPTDVALGSSALGNGVIQVFAAVINWINSNLGGAATVHTACGILTNPFVQGALALTSFIPGGGAVSGAFAKVFTAGAKAIAEKTITDLVKSMAASVVKKATEALTKDALKNAAKIATKEFLKMAGTAGGIFLAGYLTERYAIPYLARVISGTINSDLNGVVAADTIGNGLDATNQVTAQQRGMVPLSQDSAAAFNDFNNSSTATYVADMRAQSNPFDINDPYSASNALASTFYSFSSKIKNSSLLTAPAAILSSLNINNLFGGSTALAADGNTSGDCNDTFLQGTKLALTMYCNVEMGFNDVGMMQTADPDTDVTQWMLDNNQIDGNGDPIVGSDFAKFSTDCLDDSKQITDVGEDANQLPEYCYDVNKNNTEQSKMFHLYVIDNGAVDGMDNPPTNSTTNAGSTVVNPTYIKVGNIPTNGMVVGASVFGGKLDSSSGQWTENLADNGGNDLGDHGNHMTGVTAFAELGNGTALGGIPDGTKLEIDYNGRKVIATKEDIGAGGADVNGHKRAIDLWWQTANLLNFQDGTGVVTIHAVDPGTEVTPISSTGNPSLRNLGFTLSSLLTQVDYRLLSNRGFAL
jgi:hypothetical protein